MSSPDYPANRNVSGGDDYGTSVAAEPVKFELALGRLKG